MIVACFDLEGVFVPEIWIDVSKKTGIKELALTTRDIPDYDELMKGRLSLLNKNGISMKDIQEVIDETQPLKGAREFLDWVRSKIPVVILSDTYYSFAGPLMDKLGHPTLFCHELEVGSSGMIENYKLRIPDQKRKAVLAFRGLNFKTLACGDSYNDVSMILEADHGIFFRAPDSVLKEFAQIPSMTEYAQLKERIKELILDET